MSLSAWMVGSFTLASNATIVCNGNNVVINAGTYYLRDSTGALSLIDLIAAGISAIGGLAGTTVRVSRDRKIRIVSGGGALTLTIPASLQAVLGLPGSPAVGTTVTASSISTLLWSPGWRGRTLETPLGITGRPVNDIVQTSSPTGETIRTTRHHQQTVQGWAWTAVPQDRTWTTDAGLGGEFKRFYDDVLSLGYRFKHYDSIDEDSSSTTAVTWTTAYGPYIMKLLEGDAWYKRMVNELDTWATIEIVEAALTSEVS